MKSESVLQRKTRRYKSIFRAVGEQNNQLSRSDLCEITKNSMTSVNQSITSLINDGLIVEQESSEGKVGRKPMFLSVIEEAMYFCGIECSSYSIDFVVINAGNQVIEQETIPLNNPDTDTLLNTLKSAIIEYSTSNKDIWDRTKSITFSLPGHLDKESGTGVNCSSISDWNDVDVKAFVSSFCDKKTFFIHNIDSLLLGYLHHNNIPTSSIVVFIMIRNGIGVRIFSNGTLLSDYGLICEFGHVHAPGSSRLCRCGKTGCYNAEVSIPATINKIREVSFLSPDSELAKQLEAKSNHEIVANFANLCASGDADAMRLLEDTSKYIAELVAGMTYICEPDKIVLSSEFTRAGEVYKNLITENITGNCRGDNPSIDYILTDNDYGSIGCALTGYNYYLEDEDDYDELMID